MKVAWALAQTARDFGLKPKLLSIRAARPVDGERWDEGWRFPSTLPKHAPFPPHDRPHRRLPFHHPAPGRRCVSPRAPSPRGGLALPHHAKTFEIEITYNADWLANTRDYWYRGNSVLRTTTPTGQDVRTIGADSFAGQELDFIVRWKPTSWLSLDSGYAHFFTGSYLRDTGPADDAGFGYVQAQILF